MKIGLLTVDTWEFLISFNNQSDSYVTTDYYILEYANDNNILYADLILQAGWNNAHELHNVFKTDVHEDILIAANKLFASLSDEDKVTLVLLGWKSQ